LVIERCGALTARNDLPRLLRLVCLLPLSLAGLIPGAAHANGSLLAPLVADGAEPPPPWHVAGLPRQTKPLTRFSVVDVDGQRALRVEADASYGNLVHAVKGPTAGARLSWRWRVDRLVSGADLRLKPGDDVSLKVCVAFDEPLQNVPFVERQVLRIARTQSSEPLPAATVCYVWDTQLPPGTMLANPFTKRLRYVVLQSGTDGLRQWVEERRDVGTDFLKLFGAEVATVPPIIGVAIGADADNTQSRSLGFVAELALQP
jgi:Protein of unknown function (DUF3047)